MYAGRVQSLSVQDDVVIAGLPEYLATAQLTVPRIKSIANNWATKMHKWTRI